MTGLASGLASQWTSPVTESTYGVAQSLSGAKFTALDSDSMELRKITKESTGIFQGKLFPRGNRRVITGWNAGGGVVMDIPAQGLQQWLFPMFGSYGQTLSALTEDASTGAYKAVHAPGPLETHTFTWQKGVPSITGVVEPFTYTGCKITDWELSCAKDEIAKLTITMWARNELAGTGNSDPLNGSVPALATYSAPTAGKVFTFLEGSLYTGGTVSTNSGLTTVSSPVLAGNIQSVSVKHSVPLDVDRAAFGNGGFRNEPLQNGLRGGSGQYVVEWLAAEAAYDAFASDTPTAIELTFLGPGIGSGSDVSTLSLLMPLCYYDGESPKIPGPAVVTQTVPFTYLDDDANNVIQATYWTLDSA
jgi:Phage tail tube protein